MTYIASLIDRYYQSRKAHLDEMASFGCPADLEDRLLTLFLQSFEEDLTLAECVHDLYGNVLYSDAEADFLFQALYAADAENDAG